MIRDEGVWEVYETRVAAEDISQQLEAGQTFGLIGPNGAGKTMLLRMLATRAKPDRGNIATAGLCAGQHARDIRRRITFMPAEFGSPPDMKLREYMSCFAGLSGIGKKERDAAIVNSLHGSAARIIRHSQLK